MAKRGWFHVFIDIFARFLKIFTWLIGQSIQTWQIYIFLLRFTIISRINLLSYFFKDHRILIFSAVGILGFLSLLKTHSIFRHICSCNWSCRFYCLVHVRLLFRQPQIFYMAPILPIFKLNISVSRQISEQLVLVEGLDRHFQNWT